LQSAKNGVARRLSPRFNKDIREAEKTNMRARFWIGLAAVALIAIGAIAGALLMRADDNSDHEQSQREEAARAADQAEAVASLSIGQLAAGAAFLQADGDLNQHEFEVIGGALLDQGVLDATAFLPKVTAGQRAGWERRNGVAIKELDGARLRPATERPVYYPIAYVVSGTDASRVIGYDLGTNDARVPTLRQARDSGEPAATPALQLLLGGEGVNVFQPVYRDGAPTATQAQRRRALVGFVAGSFEARDLAGPALAALDEGTEAQLNVGSVSVIGPDELADEGVTAPVEIADRTWYLVINDPDNPDVSLPILLAVVGISLASLLASLILVWSRNERMEELQRQASQDPLTGLKNRRRFDEDLRTAMARARRERTTGALLMLDLDHFKRVNDVHGHGAGDRLIVEIAELLRRRTRESDSLGRLGGDEFAIVLPRCSREEALLTAEAINKAVREHVPEIDGLDSVTVCVGVAMFGTDPRQGAASVASQADAAMYAAKDAGRDGVRIFDPEAVREDQAH
jgi:diguanylate cyclase (GGDEF)-like protein